MDLLKKLALSAAAVGTAAVAAEVLHDNTTIEVQPFVLTFPDLPEHFVDYRAVVVSDVHLPRSRGFLRRICSAVAAQRPDAVWILGDLVNRHASFDAAQLKRLARELAAIAPCFAVLGNHERKHPEVAAAYRRILTDAGILVLCDEPMTVGKEGQFFTLYGVSEKVPQPLPTYLPRPYVALAHHPEYAAQYAAAGFDAALCGHAHGGQIRIGGQGLYSPGQGILPTYTDGLYDVDGMRLLVGRGLGNGSCAVRIGNPFHLPVVILEKE